MRPIKSFGPLVTGLMAGMTAILGVWIVLVLLSAASASAMPGATAAIDLTVCPAGPPVCSYSDIQTAVNAASAGATIKVAQGVYAGLNTVTIPDGYPAPPAGGVLTQVISINRPLTLLGGYTTTNWAHAEPDQFTTIVDAQGQGRGILVSGEVDVTIAGLSILNGEAIGLGGHGPDDGPPLYRDDAGGGIYVLTATTDMRENVISGNTAQFGGGIYLNHSDSLLERNTFMGNTAHDAGGLYVLHGDGVVRYNLFTGNFAHDSGGLFLYGGTGTVRSNLLLSNTVDDDAGGMGIYESGAWVVGNVIRNNQALDDGGGIDAKWSEGLVLEANQIVSNATAGQGGGIYINGGQLRLDNNVVGNNRADDVGGGIYVELGAVARMRHTTIAANQSGDGAGITVVTGGQAVLSNTILVSHTVGVVVNEGSVVTLTGTLWGNGVDWSGPGQVMTGTTNWWSEPAFVDAAGGDFHIRFQSGAVDAGVATALTRDMDGEPRLVGEAPDIGADELWLPEHWAYLPAIWLQ